MHMSPVQTLVSPKQVSNIGGFIGERFEANLNGRLKNWHLMEEFIRMHEAKDHDGWFWLGEQVGKWLDGAAYAWSISGDERLKEAIEEILVRLRKSQEDDGYLGITRRIQRTPVRGMQLYEWYYVLHGLLVCHELLDSALALEIAVDLTELITKYWGTGEGQYPLAGPYPGNGHDGGEGTLILEPVVLVAKAADRPDFLRWAEDTLGMWDAWADQYPESVHTGPYCLMKKAAAGEVKIYEIRENIHAHTFHMTLLGLAVLYETTGTTEYRDVVLGCIRAIADEYVFISGGMSAGERYVEHRYYNPRNEIEVCPQHTWLLLLEKALNWTGEARFAEEIERTLFNSFLAAQLADGSNWSYMTPLNGRAQEPFGPNCCNAAGHRIAGRMPAFAYGQSSGATWIHQFIPSQLQTDTEAGILTWTLATTYPENGAVTIRAAIGTPVKHRLNIRIPSFVPGPVTVRVAGETFTGEPGVYLNIDRVWHQDDEVSFSLPLPVRVIADGTSAAVCRGPIVYCYFQECQPEPMRFHWIRGVYPEDVELQVEGQQLTSVEEAAAPDEFLGPGLLVGGGCRPRPKLFAGEPMPDTARSEIQRLLLLPFANQGRARGHYAVFLRQA